MKRARDVAIGRLWEEKDAGQRKGALSARLISAAIGEGWAGDTLCSVHTGSRTVGTRGARVAGDDISCADRRFV